MEKKKKMEKKIYTEAYFIHNKNKQNKTEKE